MLGKPRVMVFNKIDQIDSLVGGNICKLHGAYGVSALERRTMRPLLEQLESMLWQGSEPQAPEWVE